MFNQAQMKVIVYINLVLGVILGASGAITAYFHTLGNGAGETVSLVLAGLGLAQTLLAGLLQVQQVKAQAMLISSHATARSAGLTAADIAPLL